MTQKNSIVSSVFEFLISGNELTKETFSNTFNYSNLTNVLNRIRMRGYDILEDKDGAFYFSQETIDKHHRGEINNG